MLLSSLFLWMNAWGALSLLDSGAHCVAYKAEKVVFFVSSSSVIGKNCDISAQVLPEVGGLYHIEVIIPLHSFSSGDVDRDRDVMAILKNAERPEMTFRTKAMTSEEWRALFAKLEFDIEGELSIGNRAFPLKLHSRYLKQSEGSEVDGVARVRFADFDIRPPKVVAGIVAKAKPDLELHFHLLSQRILGADSIRLESIER